MTSTLRATLGPVYRFLNGIDLPSWSRIGKLPIFFSVSCEGISLFVFTSPSNSAVLSMLSDFVRGESEVSIDGLGMAHELCDITSFATGLVAIALGIVFEVATTP